MGRVRSVGFWVGLAIVIAGFSGCGKKSSGIAPVTIHLSPATLSLEQGKFSGLLVTDQNGAGIAIGKITWQASDSSALSVAPLSGVPAVCAGTWNSLTVPTICSPGPARAVQLTATAEGATSAPITVYVHQHIERLVASIVSSPISKCPVGLSAATQFAPAEFADYQVTATNNGNDITSTVGPITWTAQNSTIVTLVTTGTGLLFNQTRATAKTPGQTSLFASAGNATSAPAPFTTCPIAQITLATATGTNSLSFLKGAASQTITATVIDAAGLTLTNPPITWSTSNPTVASVSTAGAVAGLQTGAASITAACLPANCNIGFQPEAPPIYPPTGIGVTVQGAASSTTVYAASSGCWDKALQAPVLGCLSFIIPIPQSSNTPGSPIALPHTPTSMMMSASGTETYVGSCVPRTAGGQPVCNGIAVVSSAGAVTTNNAVTGDVVGVSPTGSKAVISDTSTTPNQVFLYDQAGNTGTQLLLATSDHAKSAVFSPDNFQVYITTYLCTGSPCQPSNEVAGPVYVFDAANQLRRLSAPSAVTAVAFHPSGAFVYITQATNAVTVLNTSDNSIAASPDGTQTLALPGAPQFLRALNDWDELTHATRFMAFNGPNATGGEIITATSATPPPTSSPCAGANSFSVCNATTPLIDFNQGPLDVSEFLLSSDGSTAYVVPRNFSSVFSYNLVSQGKTGIALVGGQATTTGGLTTDGAFLYVGSADGLVHVLNTAFSSDTLQISPISGSTNAITSMCSISTATQPCNPDFVLVKP